MLAECDAVAIDEDNSKTKIIINTLYLKIKTSEKQSKKTN